MPKYVSRRTIYVKDKNITAVCVTELPVVQSVYDNLVFIRSSLRISHCLKIRQS